MPINLNMNQPTANTLTSCSQTLCGTNGFILYNSLFRFPRCMSHVFFVSVITEAQPTNPDINGLGYKASFGQYSRFDQNLTIFFSKKECQFFYIVDEL